MWWTQCSGWLVRASCVAAAACCAGAAGGQSLFVAGPLGFTEQQARAGQTVYAENCAQCHGPHLNDGQFGPPLKGPAFKARWHEQPPASLWASMIKRMPPASPGSLDGRAYAEVEAFLLRENGEQAGTVALVAPSGAALAAAAAGPARISMPRSAVVRLANEDATYHAALAARTALLGRLTPVSDAMLQAPAAGDWLMWRGTYATLGYSPLAQINKDTVHNLGVAWTLALPPSANETAPLIHDGVLFIESANTVEAINAVDGSILWQYLRALPEELHGGRDARMRGLAIYQDKLYAPTADGHIVALDVKSGDLRWDHAVVTPEHGSRPGLFDGAYFHISGGPLLVHGKVIVGVSLGINTGGGDFIVGLDAQTGHELWRFNTIARPGQPGGDSWNGAPVKERYGSGVWSIGSYDPELNLVYFGTGNTYDVGTLLRPRGHQGLTNNDALYTDSTVALDADTGKLAWYYQHMNRDVWDLDWAFEQSLVTLPVNGKPTESAGDRRQERDLRCRQPRRWPLCILQGSGTAEPGRQHRCRIPAGRSSTRRSSRSAGRTDLICPTATGARSWPTTAFDPASGYLYVPLVDNNCMDYRWVERDAGAIAGGGQDMRLQGSPQAGQRRQFRPHRGHRPQHPARSSGRSGNAPL